MRPQSPVSSRGVGGPLCGLPGRSSVTYEVVEYTAEHREGVLSLLQRCFGRHKTSENFAWKHEDGPWGPSVGWVAVRSGDVLGVRLLVPWQVQHGEVVVAHLAGHGWRRRSIREATGHLFRPCPPGDGRGGGEGSSRRSTRPRYLRLARRSAGSDGSTFRRSLTTLAAPPLRRISGLESVPAERLPLEAAATSVVTHWTPAALAWRTDPRSGHSYGAARSTAERDAGLIYRVTKGRLRRLVVLRSSGTRRAQLGLIGSVAASAIAARSCCLPYDADVRPMAEPSTRRNSGVHLVTTRPMTCDAPTSHGGSFDGTDLEGAL